MGGARIFAAWGRAKGIGAEGKWQQGTWYLGTCGMGQLGRGKGRGHRGSVGSCPLFPPLAPPMQVTVHIKFNYLTYTAK